LGYSHVNFDARFLSTIYDEWINIKIQESKTTSIKHIQNKYDIDYDLNPVGIKYFEANYQTFIDRMLSLAEIRTHLPFESLQTNGYSVCLLFEKEKRIHNNENNNNDENNNNENNNENDIKINLDEYFNNIKNKKGLFDAENSIASEDFLNKFHKIGIDPNNKIMLYGCSETEIPIKVSKGYYNETSHITKNTKKTKRYIKEDKMNEIYDKLSNTNYKKTIKIDEYNKYILIIRENWNSIWTFYSQNKLLALELDTFINKKKTIHKIVRKIVPKKKTIKFNKFDTKYVKKDQDIFEKPPLVFFGKGNGNSTISNLRNSSSKGPIKAIINELSKFCIVILVDEFRTSKICSNCKDHELIYPQIEKTKIQTKDDDDEVIIIKKNYKSTCHGLCYCKNNIHPTTPLNPILKVDVNVHKIWNRDYNSSRNISYVGNQKLMNKGLGKFNRKKVIKSLEKEESKIKNQFCWPLGQHCPEKGKTKEVIKKM